MRLLLIYVLRVVLRFAGSDLLYRSIPTGSKQSARQYVLRHDWTGIMPLASCHRIRKYCFIHFKSIVGTTLQAKLRSCALWENFFHICTACEVPLGARYQPYRALWLHSEHPRNSYRV